MVEGVINICGLSGLGLASLYASSLHVIFVCALTFRMEMLCGNF